MYKSKSIHTKTAIESIAEYIKNKKYLKIKLNPELCLKQACFVTLRSGDGNLRGCIGTLQPVRENLQEEIVHNAVSAAFHDSRFNSLTKNEFNEITLSVEVLSVPKKITDLKKLNPKIYGLIISDNSYRKGVLLPDIEGVDTVEKQIEIVKRKAGIADFEKLELEYQIFTTEKYY